MKYVIRCTLIILASVLIVSNSYASLLISPTKAIFEGRDRVKEITLINTSNRTNTYRIGWAQKKQTEKYRYEALSAADEDDFRKASDLIRFSPKQVTLQAGERQIIKMLVRRNSEMQDGDYRSHLTFTIIPTGLEEQISQQTEGEGMAMRLNVFVNYSIPVVVRNGLAQEKVNIVSLQAMPDTADPQTVNNIKVDLERDGNFGSYGRLDIMGVNPESGQPILLGQLNGFNFLHETKKLTHFVPITNMQAFKQQTSVTVNFVSDLGAREIISSKQLQL